MVGPGRDQNVKGNVKRDTIKRDTVKSVPVVDLASPRAGAELDQALRALGFVQLAGHGITSSGELWDAMDELFARPLAQKQRWSCDDPLANRGYRRRGSEALAYSLGQDGLPPDLFESFNVRHDQRTTDDPLMAASIWPDEVPSFRPAAEAYLSEVQALAHRLDWLLGSVVGIRDLAERSTNGPDAMACIRYQHQPDERKPLDRQARMGAHSDYTSFTILCADRVPGLQILTADGWFDVVPDDDNLLLNVGDLLAIWTNNAWPSTIHRVPLVGGGLDPTLRRSVAYFHYPDLDVVVEPLTSFVDGEKPAYEAVTVGNHLRTRLVGPKLKQRSEGTTTLGTREI